jgi:hypothetical protein
MKAVLKNGAICPKEPIPREWVEGTELEVAIVPAGEDQDALDQWYAELEVGCSQMDAEDDRILNAAIQEVRQQEKELARKQMELG